MSKSKSRGCLTAWECRLSSLQMQQWISLTPDSSNPVRYKIPGPKTACFPKEKGGQNYRHPSSAITLFSTAYIQPTNKAQPSPYHSSQKSTYTIPRSFQHYYKHSFLSLSSDVAVSVVAVLKHRCLLMLPCLGPRNARPPTIQISYKLQ